ncbi:MAG: NADH-quinone oxidoreductase subunit L [Methanobacteriota archaeon]|nr:MAG: NADH-quinone oxidoreductase subunit L [Euryarchaeota archaeon]
MAEETKTLEIIKAFTGDVAVDNLIMMTLAVILIPMIAAVILLAIRFFEVKGKTTVSPLRAAAIGNTSILLSTILSIYILSMYFANYVHGIQTPYIEGSWEFIAGTKLEWSFLLDPLSTIMATLLGIIALAIHFYAYDYMRHGEEEVTRFFAFLNFFTGSMWGFIYAGNLLSSLIFWELLGVSSYFLIGYYWHKPSASAAAMKAFLYNKVGDVGFLVGIFLTYGKTHGDLSYTQIAELVHKGELSAATLAVPALLIFIAAVGKSSQFPLFGWLPEAMEGPTPVSALLHSSTMVKAGLLLLMRNFLLYYEVHDFHAALPEVNIPPATIVTWIGVHTALMGALMAMTSTDIKRILAFSTISQLGYIASAIGAGGISPAFFHLVSHATFKSLLFLGAGAVIHNLHHVQDIRQMGGLRRHMPKTAIAMGVGLLALAGFPFTSGFVSKDAVILSIENSAIPGHTYLAWVGIATAFITAFYSTRMFYVVFLGEERYDKEKIVPHASSTIMVIPLWTLMTLIIIESIWFSVGFILALTGQERTDLLNFEGFLGDMFGVHASTEGALTGAITSAVVVLLGMGFAWYMYAINPNARESLRATLKPVEDFINNRFGVDIAIFWFVNHVALPIGNAFKAFDQQVIDGLVNFFGKTASLAVADISDQFDQKVIDGVVNGSAYSIRFAVKRLRRLQDGIVGDYAKYMILSVGALMLIFNLFFGNFIVM